MKSAHVLLPFLTAMLAACAAVAPAPEVAMPAVPVDATLVVIAHRGASALRPEHTLAAYAKAIEDGADAIEPDLVMTRDGVLVARHENEIGGTTDVGQRPEFAGRKTRKRIDGQWVEGWFTEDFSLAELKTLRARERLPQLRSAAFDGRFEVPTLDEVIALAESESRKRGRMIGLVPEIKHPTYFAGIGLAMEQPLLDALARHAYTRKAPVVIQSFEVGNLRALRGRIARGGNLRLLQLLGAPDESPADVAGTPDAITYAWMASEAGLRDTATYADAIGPHYLMLQLRRDAGGTPRSALVDAAHAAGLQVIAYTFRPENHFLEADYRDGAGEAARNPGGSIRQMRDYLSAGVDALFTDDPALGRRAARGR